MRFIEVTKASVQLLVETNCYNPEGLPEGFANSVCIVVRVAWTTRPSRLGGSRGHRVDASTW